MRKIFLFISISIIFLVVSCGEDSNPTDSGVDLEIVQLSSKPVDGE